MCWLLCLSADIILLSLCAVHIETEVKLDFKDVLIRPKRFPSGTRMPSWKLENR